MTFDDLGQFFSTITLECRRHSEESTITIALICIDVPYSLVRLLVTLSLPKNIQLLDYAKGMAMDAALVICLSHGEYPAIQNELATQTDFVVFATEKELLSRSPVIGKINDLVSAEIKPPVTNNLPDASLS